MTWTRGRMKVPINGEMIAVPAVRHMKCPRCGEIVLTLTDADRLHDDAIALYRARHGLLSGDDIRGLRHSLGLNQAALARLLHLGANTISRWESGRNVQTAAMDILLRLIRDVPGNVTYLRKHAA